MLPFIKRIILRMIDFYRRAWQAFLAAFVGSMGIASYLFKDYRVGFVIMLILALIFLVMFLIGIYHDYRYARSKEFEVKDIYNAVPDGLRQKLKERNGEK